MHSMSRRHFTCSIYRLFICKCKRNDIREPNIVLCLAVEFLSHGPSKKKKKKKKKKKRFYQVGSVIKPHCCLTSRKQLVLIVLTACVRPFKPGILKSVGRHYKLISRFHMTFAVGLTLNLKSTNQLNLLFR